MGWGPMNQIGERIKTIRLSLGLSMEEFGKLFTPNVDKSLISRWEKEVNLPNNERIKRIAEIGKVSIDYLKNGELTAGKIIKNWRLESKLSNPKFSILIGISKGYLSQLENDLVLPNHDLIRKISKACNKPINILLSTIGLVELDTNVEHYKELEKRNIELIEENIKLKAKLDMIYEVIKT
ncbi:helix-turn-helix domain-containing protein [Carnobacterium maltaromaticum]|uniref:helix-turn-helix domain-containing protein n=1 Tax=Carnobacterium maltaromaticum TaxID=2751 RepID=UPI00191BC886|nr:helix-turn-helix transcriptional regulator [Carnobacterium maltaromaticum]CAD5902399.1 hypothetical protein CMALT394_460015 [Carnobacterium maltaromaticum]